MQDCRGGYGKGVLIYEILFKDGVFVERQVDEYDNSKLVIDGKTGVDYFHTYTKTSKYEVVDYIYEKIDLLKEIKWQIRKYKKRQRAKSRQK